MLFNENRILQDNNQSSISNTTLNSTITENSNSNNSLIFIIVFSAPAGLALILFIFLLIIRKCKKPKSGPETQKNSQSKTNDKKPKISLKSKIKWKDDYDIKDVNNTPVEKSNLNINKTSSRIGLIQEKEKEKLDKLNNKYTNENLEKKNSKIISNENFKRTLTGIKNQTDVNNENLPINNEQSSDKNLFNPKSPLKKFWKVNSIKENDPVSKKLGRLRQSILKNNPTDSTNSFSHSKFSFNANSSHS